MSSSPTTDLHSYPDPILHGERYYQHLQRRNILRLILTYLLPLVILTVYFGFQYRQLIIEGNKAHLKAIAENQANTLDLFLRERVVNLSNLIDDPRIELPPSAEAMMNLLATLKQNSETFVDIGFFDSNGVQIAYEGPYPQLENRDYSGEAWWVALKNKADPFIITDIYLGFRQRPHFTIGVSRVLRGQYVVLRATLDPEEFSDYIAHLEHPSEVYTSIVNQAGYYQVVTPQMGAALALSSIIPPRSPKLDSQEIVLGGDRIYYGYSWLRTCDWALIVQATSDMGGGPGGGTIINIVAFSAAVILLIFSIIVARARKIVREVRKADIARAELTDNLLHASKLAAVGELASGIAHEINNPLAIINEEVGLIKDMMDPEFKMSRSLEDLKPGLNNIEEAVFRCRDITRKLLAFVRRTELNLQTYDIHEVIDGVVKGFYAHELAVSNVELSSDYWSEPLFVAADRNQLQQVFLNLITNAIDAVEDRGRIAIATSLADGRVYISVADSGVGMTQELLDKIFLPFFTTKQVGKGTGLGLSISYGIIKSLGGNISVTSTLGQGSTFTIDLPAAARPSREHAGVPVEEAGAPAARQEP
ncbi:MAG: hypothetical protein FJW35_01670 [Acidobacteria bacterium]|nr:hypothetical protein [Acidobacteriota bacterium]